MNTNSHAKNIKKIKYKIRDSYWTTNQIALRGQITFSFIDSHKIRLVLWCKWDRCFNTYNFVFPLNQ